MRIVAERTNETKEQAIMVTWANLMKRELDVDFVTELNVLLLNSSR